MYMYAVLYQGGGCGKQIAREGGVKIILTWNDVQKHGIKSINAIPVILVF